MTDQTTNATCFQGLSVTGPTLFLQASLSDHLLGELPRFFQGPTQSLGEMMQNAFRAGSTRVRIELGQGEWDGQPCRTLTFADNGLGCPDPEYLLCAGKSGWNESVVDPAGLGMFSLLRGQFVRGVRYVSFAGPAADGWAIAFDLSLLAQGSASKVTIANPDHRSGMTLTLYLADAAEITVEQLRKARGYYPMVITYVADGQTTVLEPQPSWLPQLAVDTPVGRLEWRHKTSFHGVTDEAVWEHRVMNAAPLDQALTEAAKRSAYPELAHVLNMGTTWRWFVNPACGVRPRLPDRSDLLDDAALAAAAGVLVEALIGEQLRILRELVPAWPDRVTSGHWPSSEQTREWMSTGLEEQLLPILGWPRVRYDDLTQLNCYHIQDDGTTIEAADEVYYDRKAIAVPSQDLVCTLGNLGFPVVLDASAPAPRITVTGLRADPESSPYLALADTIEVEGFGRLPFLLSTAGGEDGGMDVAGLEPVIAFAIVAGSVDEAIAQCTPNSMLANHLLIRRWAQDCTDEWLDWDGDEVYPSYARQRTELWKDLSRAFQPDLLSARDSYIRLADTQRLVNKTWASIVALREQMEKLQDPALAQAVHSLSFIETQGWLGVTQTMSARVAEVRTQAQVAPDFVVQGNSVA